MHLAKVSRLVMAGLITLLALGSAAYTPKASSQSPAATAGGFLFYKYPLGQPACDPNQNGLNVSDSPDYTRNDCGFSIFKTTGVPAGAKVEVRFLNPVGGTEFAKRDAVKRGTAGEYNFTILPTKDWPAGIIRVEVLVAGTGAGEGVFNHNLLGATVSVGANGGKPYAPGDEIPVTGNIFKRDITTNLEGPTTSPAGGATANLVVLDAEGNQLGTPIAVTANNSGNFSATIPAGTTASVSVGPETNYRTSVAIEVRDATCCATGSEGAFAAQRAGAGAATIFRQPDTLLVENSFVSAVGWVKPGDGNAQTPDAGSYPFRVFVRNFKSNAFTGATVNIPVPDGTTFLAVSPESGTSAVINPDGSITWTVGEVPAAQQDGTPTARILVVQAEADSYAADPQIAWKNLSSTATLTYDGYTGPAITSTSLGPKVIPADERFDTARYGFRPFPVVPVDWRDRKHASKHTGNLLSDVLNDPTRPGSTFNLYQEMSYGQLHPNGTVPSAAIATKNFGDAASRTAFQNKFTKPVPEGTCKGTTQASIPGGVGGTLYNERIRDGWYQMPGDTEYYGGDKFGSALVGAQAGVGAVFAIDDACGPTGKAVYDAAAIADPEIDYSDFDTDKDGVVDFFMMVFVGMGGNGDSQINGRPPYDNIWPHSSSLEFYYINKATGEKGYVSDDQLKNLQGQPLFYTDASRSQMTTTPTEFKVFVRVGPYNVNPEEAIDKASVISHEYGHSLGLPDFYTISPSDRDTYGTWNLMASDFSQHMDIFGRQDMGWVVPRVLNPNTTVDATNMRDGKLDTHRIDWVQPDGTPYTLQGPNVHNGEAYVAKLPPRQLIDPKKLEDASPTHAWWTGSGNDFGCPPSGGHNLDIILPGLEDLPANTQTKLTFKSLWDIEWDYDYGFVLVSTDGGQTYTSLRSEKGYTTANPAQGNPTGNPNGNGCQTQYGHGITGSSGSYKAGTQQADRLGTTYPNSVFIEDSYNLTPYAGKQDVVLRFSYSTDPGLARPGWFIDDVAVRAGDTDVYVSDFEGDDGEDDQPGSPEDSAIYNGGCNEDLQSAQVCTIGWIYIDSSAGSPADHAYYLEMRDRSGFDLDGKGQSDRGPITFLPGLSLVYTDEAHGYGNSGTPDPPAQHVLDAAPEPGVSTPKLDDAAWNEADKPFSDFGEGHTDNYRNPAEKDGKWHFRYNCLGFDVTRMTGDDVGPATVPGNLEGDVKFTLGQGCAPFDYGFGAPQANLPPTAVLDVRPNPVGVGEAATFDGSGSFDDQQTADQLQYEYDFNGDGTFDQSGAGLTSPSFTYDAPGTYNAVLRVTDAGGLSATSLPVTITVTQAQSTPTMTQPPATATTTTATSGPTNTATSIPGTTTAAPEPTTTVGPETRTLYLPFVAK